MGANASSQHDGCQCKEIDMRREGCSRSLFVSSYRFAFPIVFLHIKGRLLFDGQNLIGGSAMLDF